MGAQKSSQNRILFVCHEATRTGAPLLLLKLIQWLRENTKIEVVVLFRIGGELTGEFSAIAKTYTWPAKKNQQSLFDRIRGAFRVRRLRYHLKKAGFRFVYNNTVANGEIIHWIRSFFAGTIITHFHELEQTVAHFGRENWLCVKAASDSFVVSSNAVRRYLIRQNVPEEIISLNPTFADMHGQPMVPRTRWRKPVFTIGSGGTVEWRKGADLFLQLAALMRRRYPKLNLKFIWAGGPIEGPEWERVAYDLCKMKLEKIVHFVGRISDPMPYFSDMDVFVLMSREEPFGMVAIEAALAGAPTVCFKEAGGMEEFVSGGAGVSVGYLDINRMAEEICILLKNPDKRKKMVGIAQKKIYQNHLIEHFGQRFLNHVKPLLVNNWLR